MGKDSFLFDAELHQAISALAGDDRLWCAVAFWGKGAERLFQASHDKNCRLICNLKTGGTNPRVIRALPRPIVRQIDTLHAKVYIGDKYAIVTSANASANGLGLEGREQKFWKEAGIKTSDIAGIVKWFESLWNGEDCTEISDADLQSAEQAWNKQQTRKPTLPSFADFEPDNDNFPLITWWDDSGNWKTDKKNVAKQFKEFSDEIDDLVCGGIDVEGPDDERALRRDRMVLYWRRRRSDGQISRQSGALSWLKVDKIIKKAGAYQARNKAEKVDVAISYEAAKYNVPFNISEDSFVRSFSGVIGREKYKDLKVAKYQGAWFNPARVKLMKAFWADLKEDYNNNGLRRPSKTKP